MRCSTLKLNIGRSGCNDLPKQFRGMITTPYDFKITAEDAADVTKWQEALLESRNLRIYKWPTFMQNDAASTDVAYEENTLGIREADRGRYQWRPYFGQDMCTHKAMVTHTGSNQRVILFDGNKFFMMEDDAGNLMGFPAYINVEKMFFSDGAATTKTPVLVSLESAYDVDNWGVTFPAPFYSQLLALTDVSITLVGAATSTEITVKVEARCDGTEISGLVTADFIVKKTDGTLQTVTAAEDTEEPGVYTLTGTALTSGTVTLKAAKTLSVPGYEATKPVTFTI